MNTVLSYLCRSTVSNRVKWSSLQSFYRNSIVIPGVFIQYRRHFSTGVRNGNVHISKSHIELRNNANSPVYQISYIWLRDHCRCEKCYNHTTNQRVLNIMDIPADIQPVKYSVNNGTLSITWSDDHLSNYPLSWLEQSDSNKYYEVLKNKWITWNRENIKTYEIAKVDLKEFTDTQEGLQKLLKSLVDFGVAFVENVPPTIEATEKAVQKVAHVQRTFFGDMWEFTDVMSHSDTAYTKQALGAHTDNTYLTEACGLQVFHCLQHEGQGGETLLVDGFNAANKLKETHPESYKRLSTVAIESEYIEPERHYSSIGPVLCVHPVTRELQQIRFNLFDRAPMKTLQYDQVVQFYEDLRLLATIIADPTGEWWFKLNPGTIVFINNWRILHGRAAYTGRRKMAGCYVGHADWCSKARVLGLL